MSSATRTIRALRPRLRATRPTTAPAPGDRPARQHDVYRRLVQPRAQTGRRRGQLHRHGRSSRTSRSTTPRPREHCERSDAVTARRPTSQTARNGGVGAASPGAGPLRPHRDGGRLRVYPPSMDERAQLLVVVSAAVAASLGCSSASTTKNDDGGTGSDGASAGSSASSASSAASNASSGSSGGSSASSGSSAGSSSGSAAESEWLAGMNAARAAVGETPLVWDPIAAQVAVTYAAQCTFQHNPSASSQSQRWAARVTSARTSLRGRRQKLRRLRGVVGRRETVLHPRNEHVRAGQQCGHYTPIRVVDHHGGRVRSRELHHQLALRRVRRVGLQRFRLQPAGQLRGAETVLTRPE